MTDDLTPWTAFAPTPRAATDAEWEETLRLVRALVFDVKVSTRIPDNDDAQARVSKSEAELLAHVARMTGREVKHG